MAKSCIHLIYYYAFYSLHRVVLCRCDWYMSRLIIGCGINIFYLFIYLHLGRFCLMCATLENESTCCSQYWSMNLHIVGNIGGWIHLIWVTQKNAYTRCVVGNIDWMYVHIVGQFLCIMNNNDQEKPFKFIFTLAICTNILSDIKSGQKNFFSFNQIGNALLRECTYTVYVVYSWPMHIQKSIFMYIYINVLLIFSYLW
jgi:hypothetical protein